MWHIWKTLPLYVKQIQLPDSFPKKPWHGGNRFTNHCFQIAPLAWLVCGRLTDPSMKQNRMFHLVTNQALFCFICSIIRSSTCCHAVGWNGVTFIHFKTILVSHVGLSCMKAMHCTFVQEVLKLWLHEIVVAYNYLCNIGELWFICDMPIFLSRSNGYVTFGVSFHCINYLYFGHIRFHIDTHNAGVLIWQCLHDSLGNF